MPSKQHDNQLQQEIPIRGDPELAFTVEDVSVRDAEAKDRSRPNEVKISFYPDLNDISSSYQQFY